MKKLHMVERIAEGYFFCMASDDFRFETPAYRTVCTLKKEGKAFRGGDGKLYARFCDWSVKEIATA